MTVFISIPFPLMTQPGIEDAIKKIVQSTLNLPEIEIESSTNLRDLPGVESIKILRIVASLEKKFDVRLDDQVVFQVSTIAELAGAVSKLVEERQAP
jgi:acyl carrier protein